jgi:hypothetical protein
LYRKQGLSESWQPSAEKHFVLLELYTNPQQIAANPLNFFMSPLYSPYRSLKTSLLEASLFPGNWARGLPRKGSLVFITQPEPVSQNQSLSDRTRACLTEPEPVSQPEPVSHSQSLSHTARACLTPKILYFYQLCALFEFYVEKYLI